MTPIELAREIQKDCEQDALSLDGKPLSGRTVGETFGSTLALVKVTAMLLEKCIERLDAIEKQLTQYNY